MGLFRKSYVEKIRDLANRLDEVSLSEEDLILKFRKKVTEIEEDGRMTLARKCNE